MNVEDCLELVRWIETEVICGGKDWSHLFFVDLDWRRPSRGHLWLRAGADVFVVALKI